MTGKEIVAGCLGVAVLLAAGVAIGVTMEAHAAKRRPCEHGTVRTLVTNGTDYEVVCAAPVCGAPTAVSATSVSGTAVCEREYKNAVDELYRCREGLWRYETVYRLCQAGRTQDAAANSIANTKTFTPTPKPGASQ